MKRGILGSILLLGLAFSSFSETRGISPHAPAAVTEPEIVLQKNLVCNIYSVAFSPDGKFLAAGYDNNQIRVWDAKKGTLLRTLSGHKGIVWSVAFSPDGKTLISGSADKTIKFWDVGSGKELRTLKGHEDTVSFVTYSNDGVYIASGSADRTIKFWDPENGKLLQTLTGHTRTIASIAYSNDGKYMASASWDKTVKMYYAVGGAEIRKLTGHTDSVYAVAFSPDGRQLASGSADKSIKLWDVRSGELSKSLKGSADAIWSLAFSPDGKRIAGSSADGNVRIWDIETGNEIFTLKGHKSPVRSLAYSADGTYLTSGDSDGLIKIWNPATGKCLATMLQGNNGEWVTWTPEGFLTGSDWALKNLSYTVNGKQYALAQIYDKLYRPDLVAAKIVGDNIEKEAEKSSLATIIMRGGDMPDVSFTMERDQKTSRDVNVCMHIKNVGGGIGKVLIKLNDRAFLVTEGVPSKVGQTIDLEYPISLRNGENTVAVTAYDTTGMQESAKNAQKISWEGTPEKPRLFILAVAVNNYQDPNISKLKYCVADAKGIIDTFTQYSGDLYTDVFVQTLAEKEVTKANLDKTFTDIGKKIKPDDVFILYLAGHGKTYTDGDYYYIPYDFHYENDDSIPKGGISKWQLIKDLSSVHAANLMILLDTCNSGSFVTDKKNLEAAKLAALDKDSIIERFASKGGYDLIAACSTYQYAMDDYDGHGIFTYHVIEALEGYADLNKDKRVTSTELSYYVITEVPRNSFNKWGYEQDPQRILVNLDFPVVGAKNPKEAQSLKREQEAPAAQKDKPTEPEPKKEPAKKPVEKPKKTVSFDSSGLKIGVYGLLQFPVGSYADLINSDFGIGASIEKQLATNKNVIPIFRVQGGGCGSSEISTYTNVELFGGAKLLLPLKGALTIVPEADLGVWFHNISVSSASLNKTYVTMALQSSLAFDMNVKKTAFEVAPVVTLMPTSSTLLCLIGVRAGVVFDLPKKATAKTAQDVPAKDVQ